VYYLNRAEDVAPCPTEETADTIQWTRHWAAVGLASFTAIRKSIHGGTEHHHAKEVGYLSLLGTAAMTAVVGLTEPTEAAKLLWNLTPECGALNGEYEEYLTELLARYGVNPADIDPDLVHDDFADMVAHARAHQHKQVTVTIAEYLKTDPDDTVPAWMAQTIPGPDLTGDEPISYAACAYRDFHAGYVSRIAAALIIASRLNYAVDTAEKILDAKPGSPQLADLLCYRPGSPQLADLLCYRPGTGEPPMEPCDHCRAAAAVLSGACAIADPRDLGGFGITNGLTGAVVGEDAGTLLILGHHDDQAAASAFSAMADSLDGGRPVDAGEVSKRWALFTEQVTDGHRDWWCTYRFEQPQPGTIPVMVVDTSSTNA
jgi:hypothetical protein